MIIDSSAVVAILNREPEAERYEEAIATATQPRVSVASLLEASIVVEGRGGAAAGDQLDLLVQRFGIALEPVTVEQMQAARRAWRRFGRGNHPAALNFGDCFAYALAETTGEKLLYKGEDFARTDVEAA